jgi:hypothetical protein
MDRGTTVSHPQSGLELDHLDHVSNIYLVLDLRIGAVDI